MALTTQRVIEAMGVALQEVVGVSIDDFDLDAQLADTDVVDSLDLIEIFMVVEEQLDMNVPQEEFDETTTLREAIEVFVRVSGETVVAEPG